MNRTYTPELAPDILDRLVSYAGRFRSRFGHPRQAIHCGAYLQGLLLDGERKSIEPMARRVHFPDGQIGTRPVITLPATRRALQRLLAPLCLHDCLYCRGRFPALRRLLTE